jgi:hypothetical protein
MESLNRLVTESLARHGFDRPVDYRRLHWSRWFRCESTHSLLCIPSKPGVFALAEEVMDLGHADLGTVEPGKADLGKSETGAASSAEPRRMLAVVQFGEDDDMAYVLDRMFSRQNPMRARLASGRCFVRFVVIEDETHRRSIANALNQWLVSSGEKASGIGSHFASSLELTPAEDRAASPVAVPAQAPANALEPREASEPGQQVSAGPVDSGAASNLHCPQPLPSGF